MAVRQYVGARYVPQIMGDWNDQTVYEPLSVVTYNFGSYTSKKAVPAGVAPTNAEYWALTGQYNAQVEEYRQEVEGYKQSVVNLKARFPRNFILIGDSYSYGVTSVSTAPGEGWARAFKNLYTGGKVYVGNTQAPTITVPAGFTNGNMFLQELKDITATIEDKDLITDIVVMGGTNDTGRLPQIQPGIKAFIDYASANYNANIRIGVIGANIPQFSEGVFAHYREGCKYGAQFIVDSYLLCCLPQYVSSDEVHLTAEGYQMYKTQFIQLVLGGQCTFQSGFAVDINLDPNFQSPNMALEGYFLVNPKGYNLQLRGKTTKSTLLMNYSGTTLSGKVGTFVKRPRLPFYGQIVGAMMFLNSDKQFTSFGQYWYNAADSSLMYQRGDVINGTPTYCVINPGMSLTSIFI